jgi:hypothetical protein
MKKMKVGKVVFKNSFTVSELSGRVAGMGIERTTANILVKVTKCTTALKDDDDSFENNAADEDIDRNAGAVKIVKEQMSVVMSCPTITLASVDPYIVYECEDTEVMPSHPSHLILKSLRRPQKASRSFAVLCKQIEKLFKMQTIAVEKKNKITIGSFADLEHLGTVQLIALGHSIMRWSFLPDEAYVLWPMMQFRDLECMGPYLSLKSGKSDQSQASLLYTINTNIFSSPICSAKVKTPHETRWLAYRANLVGSWKWTSMTADASIEWGACGNPWIDVGGGNAMSATLRDSIERSIDACVKLGAVAFIGTPRDFYEFMTERMAQDIGRLVYIVADASEGYYPSFSKDLPIVTMAKATGMIKNADSDFLQQIKDAVGVVLLDMHAMDNGDVRDLLLFFSVAKTSGVLRRLFMVFLCGSYVAPGSMCLLHHLYSLHSPKRTIFFSSTLYDTILASSDDIVALRGKRNLDVLLHVYASYGRMQGMIRKLEADKWNENTDNQVPRLPLILFGSGTSDDVIASLYPADAFLAMKPGCLVYRRRDGAVMQLRFIGLRAYGYVQPLSAFSPEADVNLAHMVRYSTGDSEGVVGYMDDIVDPLRPFRVGSRFVKPFSHVIFINPSEYISSVDISMLQFICYKKLFIMTLGTTACSDEHAKLVDLLSLCVGSDSNNNNDNGRLKPL